MLKVLIVEDHPIVSDSLTHLIHNSGIELQCETVMNGHAGLAWLNGNKAALVLLDINLPDMSGIEFCKTAKTRFPELRVLAVTSIEQRHIIEQMLAAGANGFVLKSADQDEILRAVAQVLSGGNFLGSSVEALLKGKTAGSEGLPVLTRREVEVLKLIADGLTNQEIAEKLFISAWTVDSHRKNLLLKFNAKNTAHLVKAALAGGLIGF